MPGRTPDQGTPVPTSLIRRVSDSARYLLTGRTPTGWFGPGPALPVEGPPEEAGRAWDYPQGANIQYQPRGTERPTFAQLRNLAEYHDITRLCLETRKDQMASLPWGVREKASADGTAGDGGAPARAIEALLAYPDRDHDFVTWQRMMLEEMLVIDAATVHVRRTKGGAPFTLELFDGSTIKPLVDERGRSPEAGPAYQQIIKGLPAWDFTRDELFYLPRNVRAWKLYGMSPVEQTILLINLALRREMHQLAYYSERNLPAALASVPASWTPKQIEEFQARFDAYMAGSVTAQSRMHFIPDGTKYIPIQTAPLFDVGDEWIARVVCFCFSLPPTPFVKQTNRASAQQQHEAAKTEGLLPSKIWFKSVMDRLIQQAMGRPNLEFAWADEADIDPLVAAQIDDLSIKNRSKTINEVRAMRGDAPVPWGDEPPAEGKPEPDPDPLALEGDDAADSDTGAADQSEQDPRSATGKSAGASTGGRSLRQARPNGRPRARRWQL